MSEDASFADGAPGPQPLRLRAMDAEDLQILAALAQDAVFPGSEISWQKRRRRFSVLVNRFRWEAVTAAAPAERVQSVLVVEDVGAVRSLGVSRDGAEVHSLLDIGFTPGDEGSGAVVLTLAGGGMIELAVEVLEITLTDVTRPYVAPSRRTPGHPD